MSINVTKFDQTGKKLGTFSLPEEIFNTKVNEELLVKAVRVYQANQRQSNSRVQTRAEVSYSTAKIWRQKGTGRARHGSRRAPIFVGGGSAHGPTGMENYKLKLTKTMRKQALKSALSVKTKEKAIAVIEGLNKLKPKTKEMALLVEKVMGNEAGQKSKLLIVMDQPYTPVIKASSNLVSAQPTQAMRLNVHEILNHTFLLLTPEAVSQLEAITGSHAARITPVETEEPKKETTKAAGSAPKKTTTAKKAVKPRTRKATEEKKA